MNQQTSKAQVAIQKQSASVTLVQAIGLLREEKNSINQELAALPAAQWLEARGRELGNREQELHITIDVLGRMFQERAVGNAADVRDADRYRWLRSRDLDAISQGGVFAGMTPENVILNGEDLDEAIDAAIAAMGAKEGGAA